MEQPADVAEHCRAIVARARQMPLEQVQLDSSLEALQVDSLDKVSLCFDLEDAYDLEIPDSALFEVRTVGDIAERVQAALDRRAAKVAVGATPAGETGSEEKACDATRVAGPLNSPLE